METSKSPSRTLKTAAVVLMAASACLLGWFAFRSKAPSSAPDGVWEYIRDRVVEGDGEAPWRMMLPEARPKFLEFVRKYAEAPDGDATAAAWRKKTGLSREDLKTLPPEKIMAREYLANVERIRGSRVYGADPWPGDRAFLRISLKDGGDTFLLVRRTEGSWRIVDLVPLVTAEGYYSAYPGSPPEKVPVPK